MLAKGLNAPVARAQTAIAGRKRRRNGLQRYDFPPGAGVWANLRRDVGQIAKAIIPQAISKATCLRRAGAAVGSIRASQPGRCPPMRLPITPSPIPNENTMLNPNDR